MLKSLEIKRFRSINDVCFHFSKGVNVIIGLPDAGKSNALRALHWQLKNRPSGKRMLSDFSNEDTSVKTVFDNGKRPHEITLEKNKKSARYIIDGTELSVFGTSVPEEVAVIANLGELNFQKQLDVPFLITESSGEVGKIFNRITKTERSDEAVSLITTDVNSKNKALRQMKPDCEKIKESIKALGDVETMEEKLLDMEEKEKTIQVLENNIFKIRISIASIDNIQKKIDSFLNLDDMQVELKELQELLESYNSKTSDCNNLRSLVNSIVRQEREQKRLLEEIEEMNGDMAVMLIACDELERIEDIYFQVIGVVDAVLVAQNKVDTDEEVLKKKAEEYKEFLSTISICPFCEKCKVPIKDHNLAAILKGIL